MLELEKDLHLTAEDFPVMRTQPSHDPQDLAAYLDFLEGIWAFEWKKADVSLYTEEFRL
jgi:hypothetical protein